MKILSWMASAVIPFTLMAPAGTVASAQDIEQGEHSRVIRFQTDVGSAMNVDLSPDGKWVAFDLLGDIYIVSSTGGQATRVTQGAAWDIRPVWSPDGQQLAFIGDQDGTEQAHVIEPWKGGHRWQVTKGKNVVVWAGSERAINTLEWSPDGQILILTSAGTTHRLPLHGVATSGPLEVPKDTFRNLYYSNGSATYRFVPVRGKGSEIKVPVIGGFSDIYEIRKLDGAGKDAVTLDEAISVFGWEPPLISRNGRWIVYRDREPMRPGELSETSSQSRPFATHADTVNVYDTRARKSRVLVSGRASKGWRDDGNNRSYSAHRRFAISADSRTLIISYGGKIHKIDIGTGKDKVIDFVADVALDTPPLVKHEFKVRDHSFKTQNIRAAQLTPDNKALVFNALRYLYKFDVRRGTAKRLVAQSEAQFQPSISPDGKSVAYVTWNAVAGGHVWTVPIKGGSPTKVTKAPGYYQHPAWSPDGHLLAFVGSEDYAKERGGFSVNVHSGNVFVVRLEAAVVNRLQAVARFGNPISFSSDGRRIRFSQGNDDVELRSSAIDGSDERSENISKLSTRGMASIAVMSPDGKLTAAIKYGNLYVVRCKGNELGKKGDGLCEELKVTHDGAADPMWTHRGAALEWTFSDTHYRADAQELTRRLDQAGASATTEHWSGTPVQKINVKLEVPVAYGRGLIALRGAKIIPMRGDEVIENGTVVVKDGRIVFVGPSSEAPISRNAKIVDVSGMTIVPGFIDMHAHQDLPRDLLPQNYWESLAYLAFGVTTVRDPSAGGDHPFAYSELVDAGVMTGPRIVPAVGLIPSEARIDSLQDALDTATRYKRLGGTFLKYHSEWDRYQRQWIIDAARKSGMNVATHHPDGGGRINLTTVLDGATTAEHEITPGEDLFDDVRQLIAKSGVSLNFASLSNDGEYPAEYWPQLKADPRTLKFYRGRSPPKPTLDNLGPKSAALLPLRPSQIRSAEFLTGLMADGSPVAVGSHGNYDGFGFHLEMWTYGRGGMKPHDILKAATINGARGLGMEKELGSIEVGKVADLVILASDPLEDIRNSLSAVCVMKSGMLRNAATLDLVWPESVPLPAWQSPGAPAAATVMSCLVDSPKYDKCFKELSDYHRVLMKNPDALVLRPQLRLCRLAEINPSIS